MRLYIQTRVRKGPFSTPSEFIRTLVREDEKRHTVHSRFAQLLDGTIATSDLTETDWISLQDLFQKHFGDRTSRASKRGRSKRARSRPTK